MKSDPTTTRVVAELADALLPRLKEVVERELSSVVRAMPRDTAGNADEALVALDRLRKTGDETALSLALVEKSIEDAAAGIRIELERLLRELEPSFLRMKDNAEAAAGTATLLRALEAAIPDWEGILKADGRAHTRELSELSAEISELLRDTRSILVTEVGEVVEKEFAKRDERLEQLLRENEKRTELKLAKLQKIAVASTALFGILCALVLALLVA